MVVLIAITTIGRVKKLYLPAPSIITCGNDICAVFSFNLLSCGVVFKEDCSAFIFGGDDIAYRIKSLFLKATIRIGLCGRYGVLGV